MAPELESALDGLEAEDRFSGTIEGGKLRLSALRASDGLHRWDITFTDESQRQVGVAKLSHEAARVLFYDIALDGDEQESEPTGEGETPHEREDDAA